MQFVFCGLLYITKPHRTKNNSVIEKLKKHRYLWFLIAVRFDFWSFHTWYCTDNPSFFGYSVKSFEFFVFSIIVPLRKRKNVSPTTPTCHLATPITKFCIRSCKYGRNFNNPLLINSYTLCYKTNIIISKFNGLLNNCAIY